MLIGEVARRSGVSARMLRHYESLGLVRPTGRSGGNYREYSDEDIRRIFHIESLRSLGLSLRDVGRALDDPGFAPAGLVDDLIRRTRERIAAETELLTHLTRIDAASPAGWEDVLRIVALLQALGSESAGKRQRAALSAAFPDVRGGAGTSRAAAAAGLPEEAVDPASASAAGSASGSVAERASGSVAGRASGSVVGRASGSASASVGALVEAALAESEINVGGALRWALAQAGPEALPLLAEGLRSDQAEVRRRAVQAIARIPGGEDVLRQALDDADVVVRRHAALALGRHGVAATVPALLDMIVEGVNDSDATDALASLSRDPALADRIAGGLTSRLASSGGEAAARRRVAEALADIPGAAAEEALVELAQDGDRAVAVTAAYVLRLRARAE
ncbi:transcriptional regulator [Actinoplanes sp. OR16]|uniref:MerR family transcriptional regulator n=1 Tax=Actinoplanes sp. OR16 TaxID=946334 RepID=UPI000F6E895B|nr:MerR family transcriptional regulator [Actinoplanes sp. OR16]BBH69493.1 transcriptional regulator [Actinoplanes sp. OR16]